MPTIRLGVDSRPAEQGAKRYRDAMGRFVKRPSVEAAGAVRGVDRSMMSLRATASSVKGALGGIFAGFAAVGVLRDATKTIVGFEESLATLQGVSGLDAQSETFQALEGRARELGATTAFSAQQAAEGLLFLARAGFTAEEQLAAIGPTLDLATAGGIELGTAADTASNILSQFGLAADQTGRLVDVLVNTANSANTDVTQLGEAMKFVGPVAGALGISVEGTAAALGKLGDSGIQASSAGTNLRGILLALESPTSEARARFQELGADFDKLTSSDINTRFEELSRLQLDAADAALIFGRRNAAAALILANSADGGAKSIQALTKANEESAGVARRNAELIENTLGGSFRSLRSAVEELFLGLGDRGLKGGLKDVVDTITGAVRILAGMEESVTRNKVAAMLLADAIKFIGTTIAVLGLLKVAGLFFNLGNVILSTVGSVRALSAAFAANPIGLIAIAVGLAITAYQKFKDETFSIGDDTVTLGDIVGGVWDFIVDRFKFMARIITGTWNLVVDFLRERWDAVSSFITDKLSGVTQFISNNWRTAFDFVLNIAKTVGNSIIAVFKSVGTVIEEIVLALVRAGRALLDFDPSSPFESLANIGRALDPAEVLGNIGSRVGDNFGQDFIGAFIDGLPEAQKKAKAAIDAQFGEGTFDEFNELFNPANTLSAVRERALERARQRLANRAEGESGDALQETKSQLEAINAELATLDTGSDVAVNVKVNGLPELDAAAESAKTLKMNITEANDTADVSLDSLSGSFDDLGGSLADVIEGTKSLDDAFESVVQNLTQNAIDSFLTKPLEGIFDNLLGGLFDGFNFGSLFADGDAFTNGRRHFFNQGDVFSSPTTFPMRGGGRGTLGEAGPEGILPLDRDNDGTLGVRMVGGGGGSVENNDNRSFNMRFVFPNARNPDEFRSARRQVVRDFERTTRGDRTD